MAQPPATAATRPEASRRSENRQIWPLGRLLALPEVDLGPELAVEPRLTLTVPAEVALEAVAPAVRRLVAAGAEVTVRIQRADAALLVALAAAGADAVEWAVRAPTPGAAAAWGDDGGESAALRAAIAAAGAAGLAVRLRWRLAARAVPALAEVAALAGLTRQLSIIVLPWATPDEAPELQALASHWPAVLPAGVKLLRSELWPACCAGQDIEQATRAEKTQAAPRWLPACDGCPIRASDGNPQGCLGVAAALAERPGGPGLGWQGWRTTFGAMADAPELRIDTQCVEARGLALGLRRAWRLFLPQADVAAYVATFGGFGWHVATAQAAEIGTGGLVRADVAGQHVLTVVALTAADAETCLADERANLLRVPAVTTEGQRAHWQEIAAVHRRLGALYGYPPCCVEAFLDAHAEIVEQVRATDNAIAILRAALRTRHFDPRLTALPGALGEEAPTPLRHVPCRFDCPASAHLAQRLIADLALHNPAWHARHLAYVPELFVLFGDGTLLGLQAEVAGPDALTGVRAIAVRASQVAAPPFVQRLEELARLAPFAGLRVVAGRCLQVQRADDWEEWPLPPLAVPRAEAYPRLLPFAWREG